MRQFRQDQGQLRPGQDHSVDVVLCFHNIDNRQQVSAGFGQKFPDDQFVKIFIVDVVLIGRDGNDEVDSFLWRKLSGKKCLAW